jgi:hypothetical protein
LKTAEPATSAVAPAAATAPAVLGVTPPSTEAGVEVLTAVEKIEHALSRCC